MVDPEGAAQRAQEREAAAAADRAAEAQSALASAISITSRDLAAAYEANEVAAQQRFGGQNLLVSGRINGITLDFADEPVVQLPGVNQFLDVQVSLNDKQAAARLQQGQEVQILCHDISEVISAPMLSDCELID
jgi:hypothetical protein